LDAPPLGRARRQARLVGSSSAMVKVGLALYLAEGPRSMRALREDGHEVFLDLKLHDIPQTVHRAAKAAAALSPALLNVHALGGSEMIAAAQEACRAARAKPRLLAVTILTSLDGVALRRLGIRGTPGQAVVRLARIALAAGADGLVCSPAEVLAVRREFGPSPLIVTPGVRGSNDARGDQRRVATAGAAVRAGADYVVAGRSIWDAPWPARAAAALSLECQRADPIAPRRHGVHGG